MGEGCRREFFPDDKDSDDGVAFMRPASVVDTEAGSARPSFPQATSVAIIWDSKRAFVTQVG